MAEELSLIGVFAGENAAIERMPSMEACTAVEMWKPEFTSYDTGLAIFSSGRLISFWEMGAGLPEGEPRGAVFRSAGWRRLPDKSVDGSK